MSEKPTLDKDKLPKTGATAGAESPTTARELDFDDDNDTSAPTATTTATALDPVPSPPVPTKSPKPGVRFSDDATEIPPPKPPRPLSPQQQAINTLIEAFPSIDNKVIKAVLVASGGKVEPAFNALLSMSDPDFQEDEAPPPQPPRPSQQQQYSQQQQQQQQQRQQQPRSQLEADEQYARQLAQHYQSGYDGHGSQQRGDPYYPNQRRQTGQNPNQHDGNREPNFFDDDLPVIRKNIEQGFRETQTKVNKWIVDFKKKLDGEPDEYDQYGNPVHRGPPSQGRGQGQGQGQSQGRQNYGPSQSDQLYGIRKSAEQRRSADRDRYDSDNRVLGDNFEALELRDDEAPQQRSNRPLANPNLFKPTPVAPPQSGPVDEVDALYRNPSPNQQTGVTGGKSGGKKWQPLTSVAPHPEPEDHDPFSLGDSDEEDAKTKDIKAEDTERLKKAAEGKEGSTGELKGAERSGSVGQKDAAAEALLKEAK